jgi:hypothetical protein
MRLCLRRGLPAERLSSIRLVLSILGLWAVVLSCSAPAPRSSDSNQAAPPASESERPSAAPAPSDGQRNDVQPWRQVSVGHMMACGVRGDGHIECWGPRCAPDASASHCAEFSNVRGQQVRVDSLNGIRDVYVLDLQGRALLFSQDVTDPSSADRSPFLRIRTGVLTRADHDDCLPDEYAEITMCQDSQGGPDPVRFPRKQPWRACSATPGKKQVAFGVGNVFFLEADDSMTALLTDELSDCMGSAFQPATSGKKYALIAPTPRVGLCGLSLDQSTIDCYPNWGYFPGTLVRWEGQFRSFGGAVYLGAASHERASHHLCAVDFQGRARCRILSNESIPKLTLAQEDTWPEGWVRPKSTLRSMTCGVADCCAITDQGGVECWGHYLNGVARTPTSPECGYIQMSVGYGVGCAVDACGGLECWAGANIESPFSEVATQAPRRTGRSGQTPREE